VYSNLYVDFKKSELIETGSRIILPGDKKWGKWENTVARV
jgi:hypothetical protein